jgi:hypothetical protein
VLFGVFHLNPWSVVPAAALGALFGLLTVRTNSTLPAMIAHAGNNATALTAAFLYRDRLGGEPPALMLVLAVLFFAALAEFVHHTRGVAHRPSPLTEAPAALSPRLRRVGIGAGVGVALLVVAALVGFRLLFCGYRMASDDLAPAVNRGDRVLVLRNRYFNLAIRPGDVVAFKRDGHVWLRRVVRADARTVWVSAKGGGGETSETPVPRSEVTGKMVWKFAWGRRAPGRGQEAGSGLTD